MAMWQRHSKMGFTVHLVRGSQCASQSYSRLSSDHVCAGIMIRKGNCLDNVVAESLFCSLKQERVQWRKYQTRDEAQQDIKNYITRCHNSLRLHSNLGYKPFNQFEAEMQMPRLELQKAS